MKIVDDFLAQDVFYELQTFILDYRFAWYYNDAVVSYPYSGKEDKNEFQFTHLFYFDFVSLSIHFEIFKPILEKIKPISLWRIKANLLTITPNIIESGFHSDLGEYLPEEKLKQWTTSIFYMNTNNGYTKFEDGTIVESVANRMVTFPANMKHCGTSCTDEKRRIVINFNYFR